MPHATFVDMTREECLERLTYGSFVGRIGFMRDGMPSIHPVNYVVEGNRIVFRTALGTAMAQLAGQLVAFEVDDSRAFDHSGWSVLVKGRVEDLTTDPELERVRRSVLQSWAWHGADRWFGISMDEITGRHIPAV